MESMNAITAVVKIIGFVVALFVLGGGGLGYYFWKKSQLHGEN